MERNTIQIQHMKFRISNLQKFDLTGFCLPFFFFLSVDRVLNPSSFRPGTSALAGLLRCTLMPFFSDHVGVTNWWTSNVLRGQKLKEGNLYSILKFIDQISPKLQRWVVSDTTSHKKPTQKSSFTQYYGYESTCLFFSLDGDPSLDSPIRFHFHSFVSWSLQNML